MKKEPPRERVERATTNGPLKLCIYKYSDCAGDLWGQFKESDDTPLYQIQMDCLKKARPDMCTCFLFCLC